VPIRLDILHMRSKILPVPDKQTGVPRQDDITVPVMEEVAHVGKKVVDAGRVRVSKKVRETEHIFDEPMFKEEVTVERVPVNQYVEAAPQIRQEGDVMIIPVVEEQFVMQKRLVLVEEIRVRKQVLEIHQPQKVKLRKEEIDVKRIAGGPSSGRKR
jgi:uncharacterized protein (TIGR02271 family)